MTDPSRGRVRPALAALPLAALLALAAPLAVLAHAELVETSPADGSTVTEPPLEITAIFSEELDVGRSSISLRLPDGTLVAEGRVDPQVPTTLLVNPPSDLAPGPYEVRWTATAGDEHVERGTFRFTLAPRPVPSPSRAPTAVASPSPAASPSPSPSPAPSPSPTPTPPAAGDGSAVVPILAALAVLALVGARLVRRRPR